MRVVIALGGNALLERGEAPNSDIQETHVVSAVTALAPLAGQHQLLITHGNGPQVGVLALESARDPALSHPYPFDVLGAQTQGMIGYWLVQALHGAVRRCSSAPSGTGRTSTRPSARGSRRVSAPGRPDRRGRPPHHHAAPSGSPPSSAGTASPPMRCGRNLLHLSGTATVPDRAAPPPIALFRG